MSENEHNQEHKMDAGGAVKKTPEPLIPTNTNNDSVKESVFHVSNLEGNAIIIESSDPTPLRADQAKPKDVNGKEINTGSLVRFSRKGLDILKLEQRPNFREKAQKTIRTRVVFINSKGEVFINGGDDLHYGISSTKVDPDWLVVEI